jgi:hypothetical protein
MRHVEMWYISISDRYEIHSNVGYCALCDKGMHTPKGHFKIVTHFLGNRWVVIKNHHYLKADTLMSIMERELGP